MITSQELRSKQFEKAVFGGYDMASVDLFLENVARDIDDHTREISTLKSKMKILANKVEEYRSTEEAMRLALVSAQQLATQIEAEARAKAEAIINDATAQSVEILASLQKETAEEEAKLETAKAAYSAFASEVRDMCQRQLTFMEQLPQELFSEAAPEIEEIPEEPEVVEADLDAIIEELAEESIEIPDLITESEPIIEQPAQASDDFEATLMFSLD